MAALADHERRASANVALAEELALRGEFEWAVTLLFYAAVHYGGGLLARSGLDSTTLRHSDREYQLDQRDSVIMRRYLSLRGMSERSRYLPAHEEDAASYRRAKRHIEEIADYCRRVHAGLVPGR